MTTATLERPALDRDRFSLALQNIAKKRPRVEVDSWTEADAASYWHPSYDPTEINAVPAGIITGIVARLFASRYERTPPMSGLIGQLRDQHTAIQPGCPASKLVLRMADYLGMLHRGYRPTLTSHAGDLDIGLNWIDSDYIGYCYRKTCKPQDSFMGGCLKERAFDRLQESGYLVPWPVIRWEPVGVWLTPLRSAIDTPFVLVQRERSHVKKAVVPYWVADACSRLSSTVPMVLHATDFRYLVKEALPKYLDALKTERLRFNAMVALSADSEKAMAEWDIAFTQAAWRFNACNPYRIKPFVLFGIDEQQRRSLIDTVSDDLFPAMPDDESDEDDDD